MQITIQKMWPLEAGRKSGGFKGTDGTNYYCEIPIYHMLSEGMTIDAPAEKYVSKAGKTSYILAKTWAPPAPGVGVNGTQHNVPPQGYNNGPAPLRPAGNGNGHVPFRNPRQSFQSEVVVAALSTGKYALEDIKALLAEAGEAWDLHG